MRISDWSSDVCSSDLRGLAEHQIARRVGPPGLDDRQVRAQPGFADVTLSLEFLHWLPLGHDRTDAGLCIKSRNSRSARTNAFSQRPLRIKLQFQLTFNIELIKQLVFADIRAEHLVDLPIIAQHQEAEANSATNT